MLVMAARNQPALVKLRSEDGYKRSYQRLLTRRHQHRPLHLTSVSTAEWAGRFSDSRPAACQAGVSVCVSTLRRHFPLAIWPYSTRPTGARSSPLPPARCRQRSLDGPSPAMGHGRRRHWTTWRNASSARSHGMTTPPSPTWMCHDPRSVCGSLHNMSDTVYCSQAMRAIDQ